MNRQSNTYTVIYAVVLVLIVGVALSLVYQAMRPRQVENIANDKKKQILAAALITPKPGEDVAALFAKHITSQFIVNSKGDKVDSSENPFDVNTAEQVKLPADKRLLPVYECMTGAGMKYIVPVAGNGLWGPIWGYIALDGDGDTVYGAYFAHQGETPGLGAEIEKPAFSDQFKGKTIFSSDGDFTSIRVVKAGQEPAEGSYVHAISGGTITSTGVQKMLAESLKPYTAYFEKLKSASTPADGNDTSGGGQQSPLTK